MQLNPTNLKKSFAALGYSYSKTQPNIVGIRTALLLPDVFNDVLAVVWTQPAYVDRVQFKAKPSGDAWTESEKQQARTADKQRFLNAFGYLGKNGLPLAVDGHPGGNTAYAEQQLAATVGTERMKAWPITTNPGVYYLEHPLAGGCAVLKPNQYKGAYILGFHQDKPDHPALVQRGGPVTIYRDNDRDNRAEEGGPELTDYFGINIHRSNKEGATPKIVNWSAGCQVFQRRDHHAQLLAICEQFRESSGNKFTYTLLRERELLA